MHAQVDSIIAVTWRLLSRTVGGMPTLDGGSMANGLLYVWDGAAGADTCAAAVGPRNELHWPFRGVLWLRRRRKSICAAAVRSHMRTGGSGAVRRRRCWRTNFDCQVVYPRRWSRRRRRRRRSPTGNPSTLRRDVTVYLDTLVARQWPREVSGGRRVSAPTV